MTRRFGLVALLAGGAFCCALSAIPAGSAAAAKTHTISIKGLQFVPQRLDVAVGDTVIWKNDDIVPHTATAQKVFDSRNIAVGESWKLVVKDKGSHAYICSFHPTMKGELVVK